MKKRKFAGAAVMAGAVIMLMACGNTAEDAGTYTVSAEKIEKTPQTASVEVSSESGAAGEEDRASATGSTSNMDVYSKIQVQTKNYTGQSGDGTESINGYYQEFVFPSELVNTKLGDALQNFNKTEGNLAQKNISDYADDAADMMNMADAFVSTPYEFDTKLAITRADAQYFSFLTEDYADMHGAHPSTGRRAYTYDTGTGTEAKLSDLVINTDILPARLAKDLLTAFGQETFMDPDNLTGSIQSMIDTPGAEGQMVWYLGSNHTITFLFPQYALAPYAAGEQSLTYDLDKLSSNTDDALTGSSR